jgi:hypothetical protein
MSDYPITVDSELTLRASALQSAGAAANTGIGVGPTGLVKCQIQTTVVATGGTLDAHIEESDALGSGYADIAGAAFAQITAIGVSEIFFKATKKYVRVYGTVGTADVTWAAYIAQANK